MDGTDRPASFLAQFKPEPTPAVRNSAGVGAPEPTAVTGGYSQAVLTAEVARVRAAPEGSRNATLNSAAFNLAQVLPEELWRTSLADAAYASGLAEPEVGNTIQSGIRGANRNPRSQDRLPGHSVRDMVAGRNPLPQLEGQQINGQLTLEGLEEVERTELDWHSLWEDTNTMEWLLEPLIPAGRMVALYSAPKVGKSLLALEIAVAISRGTDVLGSPTEPVDVLYIDYENDPRTDIKPRLISMGYGPRDLDRLHYASFPRLRPLDTPDGGRDLLEWATRVNAGLVVIDTVSRVIKGKENDNDTWLDLYRCSFAHLKRNGIALLRLDHSGKNEELGMRGGSAKSGDVDAVWKLTRLNEVMLQLECEIHRIEMPEKRLILRRESGPLRHAVDTRSLSSVVEADVLVALDAAGLPLSAGREQARDVLAAAGIKVGNDFLAAIIKRRRGIYSELS